jgi:two-component system, sensor histidine kinase SagS
VPSEPPILYVGGTTPHSADGPVAWPPAGAVELVPDWAAAAAQLLSKEYSFLLARSGDPTIKGELVGGLRAAQILDQLPIGTAVVLKDMTVLWANRAFYAWCPGTPNPLGAYLYEVLGSAPKDMERARHASLDENRTTIRLACAGCREIEWLFQPMEGSTGAQGAYLAIGRDITAEIQQQKKLEALHLAGNELAALSPEQLADMSVEERIESLKIDIRRLTHDVLHYDVIEIRILDGKTGRLEPLLEEGMSSGASCRSLFASATGNGITGFVAATGKSYLCPDIAADPLYIQGAEGARSSLTAPLVFQDAIIGTLNVESPRLNAFGEDDVRFVETFGREIAAALHTLQLLSAEKRTGASKSIEAVNRKVSMPVDEILAEAAIVLERYIGHDPDLRERLKRIQCAARAIKQSILKIGEDLEPVPSSISQPETPTAGALKGMRLLVVDNDERVRLSAHSILGRFGCIVETARDGQEALTMARLGSYDAIVADIFLPDIGGYEIYCRLRQTQPQAKVILMSAYGYDPTHSIVRARQDGLTHVLFKPFRVDQLIDALTKAPAAPQRNSKCGA